jgi:nitroreductase
MHQTAHRITCLAIGALLSCTASLSAQNLKPVHLPAPKTEGGMPLMDALKNRKSTREFSDRKLSMQMISNLLWAADGINRPDDFRTAPSMGNWRITDIYVALPDGLYLWDAKGNTLQPVLGEDIRALTGTQDFAGTAALNLVYVVDFSHIPEKNRDAAARETATADPGFIGENVYLFCASEGLGCCARRLMDINALSKKMGLKPDQKIILAHSVGYPK